MIGVGGSGGRTAFLSERFESTRELVVVVVTRRAGLLWEDGGDTFAPQVDLTLSHKEFVCCFF